MCLDYKQERNRVNSNLHLIVGSVMLVAKIKTYNGEYDLGVPEDCLF